MKDKHFHEHCDTYHCRPEQSRPAQSCTGQCRPEHSCTGQGWHEQECDAPGYHTPECAGTPCPVPPPIPPVRYIPGMNVQEQLCNMADRVNTSIHRWNEIQADCYAALNRVIGAATERSVYYQHEVKLHEGYDADSGCAYSIVSICPRDEAGRPIKVKLGPAYDDVTNSGAIEDMTTYSFSHNAQAIISALNADKWDGNMVWRGHPGSGTDGETPIAGFTKNGALRVFPGNVGHKVLCQNQIENIIGPVVEIIRDGETIPGLDDTRASVQAIAYRQSDGHKFFFSCGCVDAQGMSAAQVAHVLTSYDVTSAVITHFETPDSTALNHGGMLYLGRLTAPTIGYKVPRGCAFWFVDKPLCGLNGFEKEITSITQTMGNYQTELENLMGGLDGMDLNDLNQTVKDHTEQLKNIETTINNITTNVTNILNQLNSIEDRITKVEADVAKEAEDREQADTELSQRIDAEIDDRKNADDNLQNQIEAEAAEREAADRALSTQIEGLTTGATLPTATRTRKGVIKVGENLSIAADGTLSAEPGVDIRAGTGITVTKTGKINTIAVSNDVPTADDIASLQELVQDATDKATVAEQVAGDAADKVDALETKHDADVSTLTDTVGNLQTQVDGKVNKSGDTMTGTLATPQLDTDHIHVATSTLKLSGDLSILGKAVKTDEPVIIRNLRSPIEVNDAASKEYVDQQVKGVSDSIADGSALPIATTEKAGIVRVGANLSISPDGTLSANPGESTGGNTVSAGDGISVSTDEETSVATVSLNQATKDTLASVAGKADAATVAALQNEMQANKAITEVNTQNIDGLTTTVGGLSENVTKLRTDLESVDDTATEAMTTATDAERIATQAQTTATTAKSTADSALSEAQTALEEVTGKVNKAGDVMSGVLTTPGLEVADGKYLPIWFDNPGEESPLGLQPVARYRLRPGSASEGLLEIGWRVISRPGGGTQDVTTNLMAIKGLKDPESEHDAVNKKYVDIGFLPLSGGTVSGTVKARSFSLEGVVSIGTFLSGDNKVISINGGTTRNQPVVRLTATNNTGRIEIADESTSYTGTPMLIRGVRTPATATDAANKAYVDSKSVSTSGMMPKTGGTFTGVVYGVSSTATNSLTRKDYVDSILGDLFPQASFTLSSKANDGVLQQNVSTGKDIKFFALYLTDHDGRSGTMKITNYTARYLGINKGGSSNRVRWLEFGTGINGRPSVYFTKSSNRSVTIYLEPYSTTGNYYESVVVVVY